MMDAQSATVIISTAGRTAMRICRRCRTHLLEWEDVRQELLLDLWSRLDAFDLQRGPAGPFVSMCFRHRSARLLKSARREMQARHPLQLDGQAEVGGTEPLAGNLTEADGYAAWIGQPTDGFAQLERQLDLDRALSTLSAEALTICAALIASDTDPASAAGLSRTTMHRRVHDLRYQLLAAGISGAVEQSTRPVST